MDLGGYLIWMGFFADLKAVSIHTRLGGGHKAFYQQQGPDTGVLKG